jgi:hypothetical protein
MRKPVTVDVPHQLGRVEAKRKLEEGLGQVRHQIASFGANVEETWTGDRMDFRIGILGQTVTGRIDVHEQDVRVEVDLPWMLARLAEKVTHKIKQQGTLMLEKK